MYLFTIKQLQWSRIAILKLAMCLKISNLPACMAMSPKRHAITHTHIITLYSNKIIIAQGAASYLHTVHSDT